MKVIALGSRSLMDGFALLGMETHADPAPEKVDAMLTQMVRKKQKAMIYLQRRADYEALPIVQQLRNEGGDILISEIPDILSAHEFHTPVDDQITRVLGPNINTEASHE